MPMTRARIVPVLVVMLGGAAALVMSSCNIGVPAAYILHGPPKIQAVTELDEDRSTVIFIDDPMNLVPRRALRTQIGQAAERHILEKKLVSSSKLVSTISIMRAASGGGELSEDQPSVVDLGRRVGAEVVVYIQVTKFTLSNEPSHLSPVAGGVLKVIDTVENKRLFPEDVGGYPFGFDLPDRTDQTSLSPAERNQWERSLADEFGRGIAQLFYTHERDPMSTRR
ncbi:MAG: hypothetical protein R3B46_14605 [Phycisphaerales bacterium]